MGNPAEQQPDEDLFKGSISKKEWRRKESSALSSSLPLWRLQHPFLKDPGASQVVNASTYSTYQLVHGYVPEGYNRSTLQRLGPTTLDAVATTTTKTVLPP